MIQLINQKLGFCPYLKKPYFKKLGFCPYAFLIYCREEIDTELSFLVHPAERLFDTKYKKQSEAGRKKLIP